MPADSNLLMISLDALSSDDLPLLESLPNFRRLCREGTLVKNVKSVFLSNTYPTHTSIITGTYPFHHGIFNNTLFDPDVHPPKWRYDARDIKMPTLYQKARERGKKTASILYPVTGNADIDYNFPEIAESMGLFRRLRTMIQTGTTSYMLGCLMRLPMYLMRIRKTNKNLDDLTTCIAEDTIKRYAPQLLLLHLLETDEAKHHSGPGSKEVEKTIYEQDRRIGILLNALQKKGIYDKTGIIVFSDHGCLPVHTPIYPNHLLEKKHLFFPKKERKHDAFFHSGGGTAFLRICNEKKRTQIEKWLDEIKKEPFFSRFLDKKEMKSSGMDTYFQYGIEAREGYCFEGEDHKGQHGYALKHEGYSPFYFAKGNGIPAGYQTQGGSILDICPLAAELLDLPEWKTDGINRRREWALNV